MAKTSHNISEWANNGFEDHISKDLIDAPSTEIQNRAKLPVGLETSMGVERIIFNSIFELPGEFGPNGEPVYEEDSKDPRIRFSGQWEVSAGSNGVVITAQDDNGGDFVEVSFYGTGLNLLLNQNANVRPIYITIDGGSESSDVTNGLLPNALLNSRNYRTNKIQPLTSGLSLGLHTVKIRLGNDFTTNTNIHGIEILNESSQIVAAPGSGFAGSQKQSLVSQSAIDYKPAAMTGTKGGRVVTYLKDGQLDQAFTEVGTPQYLASADHSNEELVRKVTFREFGANRSDDFSTLGTSGSDVRAFTLEDGTTTLVCDGVLENGIGDLRFNNSASDFITITFVGTGLDIFIPEVSSQNVGDLYVDGVNQGVWNRGTGGQVKLCSGLPYGTHTVKLDNSVQTGSSTFLRDFVIYQPKKPTTPAGAVELADYNVMADFTQTSITSIEATSQGVLRKVNTREFVYSGSWTIGSVTATGSISGFETFSSASGSYRELSFYGTGIEVKAEERTATYNVTLNGIPLTSANFPTATISDLGANFFNLSNGTFSGNVNGGNGDSAVVKDLPLDKYTIRFTKTDTTTCYIDAFDVITPIHINDPSLKIGNKSMQQQKSTAPIVKGETAPSIGEAKAFLVYNRETNEIINSSNISGIVNTATGRAQVFWKVPFKDVPSIVCGSNQVTLRVVNVSPLSNLKTSALMLLEANDGTDTDSIYLSIAAFGKLEDEE